MLTLKGHQHVHVDARFDTLVVPSRHWMPKLSRLFPSTPSPRDPPNQTCHMHLMGAVPSKTALSLLVICLAVTFAGTSGNLARACVFQPMLSHQRRVLRNCIDQKAGNGIRMCALSATVWFAHMSTNCTPEVANSEPAETRLISTGAEVTWKSMSASGKGQYVRSKEMHDKIEDYGNREHGWLRD